MGTCQECKFFTPQDWTGGAGKCHLFPPVSDKWAHVKAEDWCGQFQAADISSDDYDWVPTSGPPPLSPYSGKP